MIFLTVCCRLPLKFPRASRGMMFRPDDFRQDSDHHDRAMIMLECPLIFQYHEGSSSWTMTLVEVAIFSADHSLAAVDLRSSPFQEQD